MENEEIIEICEECGKQYLYEKTNWKCKTCKSKHNKQYKKDNKEKISKNNKQYYKNNIEEISIKQKRYQLSHKKEQAAYKKQYAIDNKDKISKNRKQYKKDNKEKLSKNNTIYVREKRRNDPITKFRSYISKSINAAMKKNGSSKQGESITNHLNYTIIEFKQYIESLFEPWMNWKNHGVYNPKTWDDNDQFTWKWQLDHIIPHSSFKYTSMEDESFKQCWALSNLRPYSAKQNLIDSNKR